LDPRQFRRNKFGFDGIRVNPVIDFRPIVFFTYSFTLIR
jgi:hypothetical protein